MLRQRVASAAVGVPAIVALVWAGGWWFTAAAAVVILIATLEFYRAVAGAGNRPLWMLGAPAAAALAAIAHDPDQQRLTAVLATLVVTSLTWLLLRSDLPAAAVSLTTWRRQSMMDWAWTVAGVAYVGWLGSHFVLLRRLDSDTQWSTWALLALLATFATDTAAYFVGRSVGRRKLAPHISPGKTGEGAMGGFLGGVGAVVALNYILDMGMTEVQAVSLGVLLAVFAQMGDLAESLLKRSLGVKDSGSIIPGHGGMLDRLDSVLFVAVVVYYYVTWLVQ